MCIYICIYIFVLYIYIYIYTYICIYIFLLTINQRVPCKSKFEHSFFHESLLTSLIILLGRLIEHTLVYWYHHIPCVQVHELPKGQ